jgi:dihydrofolate reductase
MFASVDGYIARRDGSIDWLATVERDGEDYGYKRFMESVDTVVLGRNTYDAVLRAESWPFAKKRCVVMTHRPAAPRNGETLFAGKPEVLLEQLTKTGASHVYVDGGSAVRAFLAAGLLDHLTLSIVPIVLGSGIPLFTSEVPEGLLVLEESRAFSTGLMQVRYRTALGATPGRRTANAER